MLVGGSGDTPGVTHLPTQEVAWQGFSKPPLLYPPVHCPGSRTLLWSVDLHFTVLLSGSTRSCFFLLGKISSWDTRYLWVQLFQGLRSTLLQYKLRFFCFHF